MAIIPTKDGKFRVEVYVNRKRISKRGFKTRTEAKRWGEEARVDYERDPANAKGKNAKDIDHTFEELIEAYIKHHLSKVQIQTKDRYMIDLKLRIIPEFKFYRISKITPAMVMAFQTKIQKELPSLKSVNNCIAVLKNLFNFGETMGMVLINPTRRIKLLKIPKGKYGWWQNQDDIQRFITALTNESLGDRYFNGKKDPCRVSYRLALECGMRLGEITGLSKQDINFEKGTILIHRQWLIKHKCYGPPKHGKVRTIGFDPKGDLAMQLKEAVENSHDPEIIFVTEIGERMRSDKLSGFYFKAWIKKLALPVIKFHDLRHTFASWHMIRGGGGNRPVQRTIFSLA